MVACKGFSLHGMGEGRRVAAGGGVGDGREHE